MAKKIVVCFEPALTPGLGALVEKAIKETGADATRYRNPRFNGDQVKDVVAVVAPAEFKDAAKPYKGAKVYLLEDEAAKKKAAADKKAADKKAADEKKAEEKKAADKAADEAGAK